MPGPLPKQAGTRRRRNTGPAARLLPAQGRTDPAPRWPLPGESEAETALWADLWGTPQACEWERLGWTRVVARYCRFLARTEAPTAEPSAADLGELRQLEDRLGLTWMAMLRLRWTIDQAPDPAPAPDRPRPVVKVGDVFTTQPEREAAHQTRRRRVKAVDA